VSPAVGQIAAFKIVHRFRTNAPARTPKVFTAFSNATPPDVTPWRGGRASGRPDGPDCRPENHQAYWDSTWFLINMEELLVGAYRSGVPNGKSGGQWKMSAQTQIGDDSWQSGGYGKRGA
jgi:hypothetical protein